jgi:hypothetical protein
MKCKAVLDKYGDDFGLTVVKAQLLVENGGNSKVKDNPPCVKEAITRDFWGIKDSSYVITVTSAIVLTMLHLI